MTTLEEALAASVTQQGDGTWTFQCPDHTCNPAGAGFSSAMWPDRQHALDRGRQHFGEHRGEGPMQTLEAFRADRGLQPMAGGGVKVADLS